jgi:hypothetical protein
MIVTQAQIIELEERLRQAMLHSDVDMPLSIYFQPETLIIDRVSE